MRNELPQIGATYVPCPAIVRISDGLPRTVTRVETRPGLDVFVVHYTTADGAGFESDNLWARWIADTGATAEPA